MLWMTKEGFRWVFNCVNAEEDSDWAGVNVREWV
jgi:hypothetical protein